MGEAQTPERTRRGWARRTSEAQLASARRLYWEQRSKGLCGYGRCQKEAANGHSMCAEHLKASSAGIAKMSARRIQQGLCRQCGLTPYFSRPFCLPCRIKFGLSPLPRITRKQIRKFWRDDAIKERRRVASEVIASTSDERLRKILTLRHGLESGNDASLEEIGAVLNLTRERVRQIEDLALFRLEQSGVDVSAIKYPFDRVRNTGLSFEERERRDNARRMLASAIRAGKIIRQPCEKCAKKAHGHNTDYSKPFDVRWLCRNHHIEAHGKIVRGKQKKPRRRAYWGNQLPRPLEAGYSVTRIRALLLAGQPTQKELARQIGISKKALIAVTSFKR